MKWRVKIIKGNFNAIYVAYKLKFNFVIFPSSNFNNNTRTTLVLAHK